jgi:putative CocE/NonD family hydrolase
MREPTHDVEVERDVKVTMPDGVVLLADVFHPAGLGTAPTILERTPYGRAAIGGFDPMGELLAARGYRFVLQAVRGTDGSEGEQSFFAERDDGRATAEWLTTQPWWDGRLGTYGSSYMGFAQWALASTAPSYLRAMVIALSSTRSSWYLGGALALELMINWDLSALNFLHPERGGFGMDIAPDAVERKQRMLAEAFQHLPVGDAILHVAGENHPLFEQQIAHPSSADSHWAPFDFAASFGEWTIPTLLIDGWFDAPLPGVCDDFAALRACGNPTALRIGGGGHLDGGGDGAGEATFAWYERHLLGVDDEAVSPPVSVHVQGEGGTWRAFDDWPPSPTTEARWYLHDGGGLDTEAPAGDAPASTYRYDPADPTPSIGGTGLMTGGAVDNGLLEARSDVLLFTSAPLAEPLELIGPMRAELVVSSSLDHTDFFVRLCDVDPVGRSVNVCDGLQRFDPTMIARSGDGTFAATVPMWPTGHRFGIGHRLRVQVSSGAHPVYARNLGTGEPPATATELRVAAQAVHHDATRVSSLVVRQYTNE